jgi:hypothetical protein
MACVTQTMELRLGLLIRAATRIRRKLGRRARLFHWWEGGTLVIIGTSYNGKRHAKKTIKACVRPVRAQP